MGKIRKSAALFAGTLLLAGTAVAQMLPDLTVTDVALDDQSKLTFEIANQSSEGIDPSSDGFVYVYVDGKVAWTYNWKYLKETGFLNAEGNSVITSQIPKGGNEVKVCVDARENVTEGDEANNCFTSEVEMADAPTTTVLPDLAVTDVYVDPFTGQLTVEHGNIGEGRVPDYNGNVNIYVDGKLKWTYSYTSMNTQFLNPGSTGVITPNKLRGVHDVTVCTSTRSVIQEVNKANNCLRRTVQGGKVLVGPQKPVRDMKNNFQYRPGGPLPTTYNMRSPFKPDFSVTDVYRDEENIVYAEVENFGMEYTGDAIGEVSFFLNGRHQASYTWSEFTDLGFLSERGSAVLPVYEVMGGHEVRVCIDPSNRVQEIDENNNCFATRVR